MAKISGDEAQLYDRQIRLWGMEAQTRLRNSSVLIIGLSGLGAEIIKNLMLSGLKSLSIMDDKQVTEADCSSNFFLARDDSKKNRTEACIDNVKLLNPMVDVIVIIGSPLDQTVEFYKKFDLVIVVDQDYSTTDHVNKLCRQNKIRFQAGGVFGWVGYAFSDFNNHTFLIPKPKEREAIIESVIDDDDEADNGLESGLPTVKKMKLNGEGQGDVHSNKVIVTIGEEEDSKIKKDIPFPSFEQTFGVELGSKRYLRRRFSFPNTFFVVRAILRLLRQNEELTQLAVLCQWKKELQIIGADELKMKITPDDFSLFVGPAFNPTCAIVGSVLGQEAIKALSQNDVPLKNVFLYSALECNGTVVDMA